MAVIADSALEVTVRETSGFAAALTELAAAWGDTETAYRITWPIVGRIASMG